MSMFSLTFPVHVFHSDVRQREDVCKGIRLLANTYAAEAAVGTFTMTHPAPGEVIGSRIMRATVSDRSEGMAKAVAAELRRRLQHLDGHRDVFGAELKVGPALITGYTGTPSLQ